MTTVAELMRYLETLPPETTVQVAEAQEGNYTAWTIREDLDLPVVAEGLNPADYSSNMEFIDIDSKLPRLFLGRT